MKVSTLGAQKGAHNLSFCPQNTSLVAKLFFVAAAIFVCSKSAHAWDKAAQSYGAFTTINKEEFLLTLEQLEQTLRQHFQHTTQLFFDELNYKEKANIIKYLPAFGYNFITQSTHLYLDIAALYMAISNKRIKQEKIHAIKREMEGKFQIACQQLYRYYDDLLHEILYYNSRLELYALGIELFHIKQQQYRGVELPPLDFISSRITLKGQEVKLRNTYNRLVKLRNQILEIAHARTIPKLFE